MKGILKNWDMFRIVRLLIGLAFSAYAVYNNEYLLLGPGLILAVPALLNWSCCGCGTSCETNNANKATYKEFVKPYEKQ